MRAEFSIEVESEDVFSIRDMFTEFLLTARRTPGMEVIDHEVKVDNPVGM